MKKKLLNPALPLMILFVLALGQNSFAQSALGAFSFGGQNRNYRVHVPAGYDPAVPIPLVFNLHGYTSDAIQQEFYTQMNQVSDTANFLVCYPNGISNSWNSGFQLPYYGGVDDVGFISVLIDTLSAHYTVDPARVYSCGMSNGGFMSFRLACDLEDRIAAIASVTGSMSDIQVNNCNCTRPMPVMQVHGTQDGTVPYNGNSFGMPVDSVISYWRQVNACTDPVILDTFPDIIAEGSTVNSQFYGGCQDGVEVLHYKVENGGHTWPGGSVNLPQEVTNRDINASVEVWNFFSRFSHPAPVLTQLEAAHPVMEWPVVAPNPISDQLQLQDIQNPVSLKVFDVRGQMMLQAVSSDQKKLLVDTRDLSPGFYILEMEQSGKRKHIRIFKQ